MLKLALAIFLSLCGVANAQLAGGLQFPGPGTAHSAGGYTGPGDINGAAFVFYGLRAYTSATRGNAAINLCDDTGANCSDVLTDAITGALNSPGTRGANNCNSSGTCRIATIYDQTGGGNDLAAIGTSQPIFTHNAVGSLPGITFTGAAVGGIAKTSPSAGPSQAFTISFVAKRTTANGNYQAVIGAAGGVQAGFDTTANNLYIFGGVGLPTLAATDNSFYAVQDIFNGASSTINSNGTASGAVSPGAGSFSGPPATITMGRDTAFGSNALVGVVLEVGVWSGDKTALISTMNSNQRTYWGF